MGEFFKPWQRKFGVVTLVTACAFACAWVRSLTIQEVLCRLNEKDTHLVLSMDGTICWERIWPIVKPRPSRWFYRHNQNPGYSGDPKEGMNIHWNYAGYGFDFCAVSRTETVTGIAPYTLEFEIWQISYWLITCPLMLLSAYLLLSTPRKSDQS